MSNGEEGPENRTPQFYGPPDGYVRRSTIFQTAGAIVGVLGFLLGLYRFIDAFNESFRIQIQNERVERLNEANRLREDIKECCWRKK